MSSHEYNETAIIKNLKRYFLFFLIGFFMACQSDDDQPSLEPSIHGFWLAADKGYIIEFTDGKNVVYNINSVGCSVLDDDFKPEDFLNLQLDLVSPNELIGSSELMAADVKFVRLPNQNEFCLSDQISTTDDPKVNFDHFWNIFNDYYVFFETRNVDWSQYKNLRDQVTTENFYDTLEELVLLLEDGHVGISDEANGIEISSELPSLLARLNSDLSGDLIIESGEDYDKLYNQRIQTVVSKYLGGNFEIDESENIAWGLVNNDIGYVNIFGMAGYGSNFKDELTALNAVLDRVMTDIKISEVSKLILDIRFNGGGLDMVSVDIASRFMDQQRIGFSKKARLGDGFTESTTISVTPKGDFQFTGDIVLLTSPITASAAEIFTLCLKDLSYVTIVGENTNGAFSDILEHVLPNGASVGLSNEVYSDAQGVVYETIGVGPNEENRIPLFSNSDYIEEKDSGIERAIELLSNNN
ncbi:S41 family peptidase [Aquimarina sp. MMG016]|uniref:S41 family peptidase n=1 Tax=Aquimarina sp. MMG016 TaxID=2822690 RepID=UPI001B3A0DFD|nr:S41 family peptidase [Aquimarina sp. MMG016]MBQ4819807.1 S41 family peptidase [Aquimarina sp. MMG016]